MKKRMALWKTLVSASAVLTLAAGAMTPALADETNTTATASDNSILPDAGFSKTYILVSALDRADAPSPAETFKFTQGRLADVRNSEYSGIDDNTIPSAIQTISIGTDASGNDNVSFAADAATAVGASANISIRANIGDYKKPGVYYYDFTEEAGNTAGVTYSPDTYRVMLPVVYDKDNTTLKFDTDNVHIIKGIKADNTVSYPYEAGTKKLANKTNSIINEYHSGGLQIKKFVTGNLGDKDKAFTITVTLSAPENKVVKSDLKLKVTNAPESNTVTVDSTGSLTASTDTTGTYYKIFAGDSGWTSKTITFNVKNGSEYELDNIPAGVTYSVAESKADGYEATFANISGDTLSIKSSDNKVEMASPVSMDTKIQEVKIANRKDTSLDTGVILNNMPYIALVAVAAAALVFFMKNQKHQEQE